MKAIRLVLAKLTVNKCIINCTLYNFLQLYFLSSPPRRLTYSE